MVRRAKFADGTPKPLPKPERSFADKLKTLKSVSQGISPESRIRLLDYFIQEALTKGQLTEEQASGIYNQLREDKDKIRKQIDDFETGNFKDPFRTTREDFSEGSKEIPIEQLTEMTEESKELSPKMKELLDNYKAEYNNAYKQILLFPERPITEEFVEKLLDARKKLMEYGYLSEEERRYHQDILDATQKTIDRFQKDPNFKIERKDVAAGGRANFVDGGEVLQGPNKGKYVLRYTENGERIKKFFDTKEEFEEFAETRRNLPKGGARDQSKNISVPTKKELQIANQFYGPRYNLTGKELWRSLTGKERQGIRQGQTTGISITQGKGPVSQAPNQLGKKEFIELAKANKGKTYKEFLEILKPYKTVRGADFTYDSIADRVKMYGLGAGFFKREPGKGFSDEAREKAVKKRVSSLDRTGTGTSADVKIKGSPSYHFHHIRQIGGEVPLTTDDIAILDQRMNSIIGSRYNRDLNKIADQISENMKLSLEAMNAKQEGKALDYMKKVDQLNLDAEKIVDKAIKELPAPYKKMVGFNKFTLPRDEYGLPIGNEPLIVKKIGGTKPTKDAKNLQDLTFEEIKNLKDQIKKDATKLEDSGLRTKILKGAGKVLKTTGKIIKPVGYAVGIGSAFQAKSIADEMGISLKPQDYAAAVEMGDPQMAINMWKMRNDPEYAAAERAKTLAIPLDEGTFEAIDNQSTFGKYNDQIKNIKLP